MTEQAYQYLNSVFNERSGWEWKSLSGVQMPVFIAMYKNEISLIAFGSETGSMYYTVQCCDFKRIGQLSSNLSRLQDAIHYAEKLYETYF